MIQVGLLTLIITVVILVASYRLFEQVILGLLFGTLNPLEVSA